MAVITVSREPGSGGTEIGQKAAQALGYHFADSSTAMAVMKARGLSGFEEEYDPRERLRFDRVSRVQERSEKAAMIGVLPQVSVALARHGNVVILGRGSFAALRGCADVLNVRVQAPFDARVKWFMEKENITRGEAEALVRERDELRAAFVRSWYGVRVDETSLFDLVIDACKVPSEVAIRWLVEMARLIDARTHDDGRIAASISVDPDLASTVSKHLQCKATHR